MAWSSRLKVNWIYESSYLTLWLKSESDHIVRNFLETVLAMITMTMTVTEVKVYGWKTKQRPIRLIASTSAGRHQSSTRVITALIAMITIIMTVMIMVFDDCCVFDDHHIQILVKCPARNHLHFCHCCLEAVLRSILRSGLRMIVRSLYLVACIRLQNFKIPDDRKILQKESKMIKSELGETGRAYFCTKSNQTYWKENLWPASLITWSGN